MERKKRPLDQSSSQTSKVSEQLKDEKMAEIEKKNSTFYDILNYVYSKLVNEPDEKSKSTEELQAKSNLTQTDSEIEKHLKTVYPLTSREAIGNQISPKQIEKELKAVTPKKSFQHTKELKIQKKIFRLGPQRKILKMTYAPV